MLDHHYALATVKDIMVETLEKLELEGANIFYTDIAMWDSNVGVTALLIVARGILCTHSTRLLLSLLQRVLALLFRLSRLSLKVLSWVLIRI